VTLTAFSPSHIHAPDFATRPVTDPRWDSDVLVFFAHQEHDRVFEELYCTAFRLLDATFLQMRAGYMDFPAVHDQVHERLRRLFELRPARRDPPRPLTFDELHAALGWTD
jgi:hypothetical protein